MPNKDNQDEARLSELLNKTQPPKSPKHLDDIILAYAKKHATENIEDSERTGTFSTRLFPTRKWFNQSWVPAAATFSIALIAVSVTFQSFNQSQISIESQRETLRTSVTRTAEVAEENFDEQATNFNQFQLADSDTVPTAVSDRVATATSDTVPAAVPDRVPTVVPENVSTANSDQAPVVNISPISTDVSIQRTIVISRTTQELTNPENLSSATVSSITAPAITAPAPVVPSTADTSATANFEILNSSKANITIEPTLQIQETSVASAVQSRERIVSSSNPAISTTNLQLDLDSTTSVNELSKMPEVADIDNVRSQNEVEETVVTGSTIRRGVVAANPLLLIESLQAASSLRNSPSAQIKFITLLNEVLEDQQQNSDQNGNTPIETSNLLAVQQRAQVIIRSYNQLIDGNAISNANIRYLEARVSFRDFPLPNTLDLAIELLKSLDFQ